jgi:hypothetical protein
MSLRDRVFSANQVKTILSIQVWKQPMIRTARNMHVLVREPFVFIPEAYLKRGEVLARPEQLNA